jgi:hypothetical protein
MQCLLCGRLPAYGPMTALIVAGDVATSMATIRETLVELKRRFEEVAASLFYIPSTIVSINSHFFNSHFWNSFFNSQYLLILFYSFILIKISFIFICLSFVIHFFLIIQIHIQLEMHCSIIDLVFGVTTRIAH